MCFRRFGPGKLFLLLCGATLVACAGGSNLEVAGPSHMYSHFTQVGSIVQAVVDGNMRAVRGGADWLATHQVQDFPEAGAVALEMMRAEARMIQSQHDLDDVALSVAHMGVACGTCHTALDGGPHISVDMAPPASSDPTKTMVRHVWAADRLWEGIIGPSEAAWASGAAVLSSPALDLGPPGNRPHAADELAQRVPELGRMAKSARDGNARAEVYGELLQTCARCHQALGMKMAR